ncbi:MAG: helix-turn-helix domain-containing protein [Lachnospiraceae bacterium]|nr:helix-turn-helix domain-containing protein [Lachnospiraceae bacterium]
MAEQEKSIDTIVKQAEEIQPPGARIREELTRRGMQQKEFAIRMNVTEKHVSKLINGEVLLTANVAMRLATVLGIPAAEWSAMEAAYRESLLAYQAHREMEEDIALAQCFPYGEMAKLGWVPKAKNVKEKVLGLRSFFEVVELPLLERFELTGFAGRKLSLHNEEDLILMAWMQAARKKAREISGGAIAVREITGILPKLRAWTYEKPQAFLPQLQKLLASKGILLVFLPRIKGLDLHCATFAFGNRVVIAMTATKMKDGEFWYRLLHEIGHVFLGHVGLEEGTTPQDETDATIWARNTLLPRKEFDAYKDAGKFTEKTITEFSKEQGVAAGILVGRLQHDGLISGGSHNRFKREYNLTNCG